MEEVGVPHLCHTTVLHLTFLQLARNHGSEVGHGITQGQGGEGVASLGGLAAEVPEHVIVGADDGGGEGKEQHLARLGDGKGVAATLRDEGHGARNDGLIAV